jgi:hypothetical protein
MKILVYMIAGERPGTDKPSKGYTDENDITGT